MKQRLTVLHTDDTQIRLYNGKWGYISSVTNEATREVLDITVNVSPNEVLIQATLDELQQYLKAGLCPILHSDQGGQYQMPDYQNA